MFVFAFLTEELYAEAAEECAGFAATKGERRLKIGQFVSKKVELPVCFFSQARVPPGSDFKLSSSIVINLASCNAIM